MHSGRRRLFSKRITARHRHQFQCLRYRSFVCECVCVCEQQQTIRKSHTQFHFSLSSNLFTSFSTRCVRFDDVTRETTQKWIWWGGKKLYTHSLTHSLTILSHLIIYLNSRKNPITNRAYIRNKTWNVQTDGAAAKRLCELRAFFQTIST